MTTDNIVGRQYLIDKVREELVGPSPAGDEIQLADLEFRSVEDSYRPYREARTGEEILAWDRPIARYGVGVLFPIQQAAAPQATEAAVDELTEERQAAAVSNDDVSDSVDKQLESVMKRSAEPQEDEFDLSSAMARRPSAMGVSFLMSVQGGDELVIQAEGGRYEIAPVKIAGRAERRRWFVRRPWTAEVRLAADEIRANDRRMIACRAERIVASGTGDLEIELRVYPRIDPTGHVLTTVTIMNRSQAGRGIDTACLFQVTLAVAVHQAGGPRAAILPYPTPPMSQLDDEEQSLALLYRKTRAFAVGHGCAADWDTAPELEAATSVRGEVLPVIETPSITPNIRDADGREISVSMKALADAADVSVIAGPVIDGYEAWIASQSTSIVDLPADMVDTATRHLQLCRSALGRMREGLALLRTDATCARAFQLANEAMLLQQLRSVPDVRLITGSQQGVGGYVFDRAYPPVDREAVRQGRGAWRPFQLAFMLMCLRSVATPSAADRELVELIWFPTGGGKTEAYLGLSAFSMFLRRLRDPEDTGVDVLMRYTLRLLTAQQFQRASTLICAMEHLRTEEARLGPRSFTIGIWLGGSTTPNTGSDAQIKLRQLNKKLDAENPFLIIKCPWCSAQIGPVRKVKSVVGYKERGGSVAFRCSDSNCEFKTGLPIFVVDEDLYRAPPSLLIGTVDKFAMLAWRPEARALFGIDMDGSRRKSPPNLIIQDELHLISGPLGTMIGLYEMVIEELSTDRRHGNAKVPKIVTSTATARRFKEQTRALFARDRAELFPPPGIDISDSYFAQFARDQDGSVARGRVYVGIHATNHNSLITTQVQVMGASLQAVRALPLDSRDAWWTNMVFFNTLRDLGTSLSLIQSNIPMYLKAIRNRMGIPTGDVRYIDRVLELTSRLRNDEVPDVMSQLERPLRDGTMDAVDICLASNIIEVGIDIDRLSLMTVVGQPKSTSQYIQVTGRIGRRWWERPGLVLTLLNPSRPRDRSHYEQFRAYHERLYAQVEPTTVTPFSPPAVERALHAALAAFVRQFGDRDAANMVRDVPDALLDRFTGLARRRVGVVEPDEAPYLGAVIDRRLADLRRWRDRKWGGFPIQESQVLANSDSVFEVLLSGQAWPTPTSMRSVDASCELDISAAYELAGEGTE